MAIYDDAGPGKLYCSVCKINFVMYNPGFPWLQAAGAAIAFHEREHPDQHPRSGSVG